MTVIAYRDGVLASDSRETIKSWVDNDTCKKIFRLPDDSVIGLSGDPLGHAVLLRELRQALKVEKRQTVLPAPRLKQCHALMVDVDGFIYVFWGTAWAILKKRHHPYYAIGSGAGAALAAMDVGASAVDAVKVAIKRDVYCGGRVQRLTING